MKPVGLKDPVISCIAFSSFRTKWGIQLFLASHSRHPERSEGSSYFSYHILVISNEVRNLVISRFALQDFTGFFRLRRQNDSQNIPRSRHPERSEGSSHFLYHNTRLYWMFRGYASQHDAKRFGVRMTAKTFRTLVILSTAKTTLEGECCSHACMDITEPKRLGHSPSSYISYHTLVTLSAVKGPVISRITFSSFRTKWGILLFLASHYKTLLDVSRLRLSTWR